MKEPDEGYKIGDLAAMFGLTVRTVRYYEELGLLKSLDRSEGLHRRYPGRSVVLLNRVMNLKAKGLSLSEIREFSALSARDPSGAGCRNLLMRKYNETIAAEEKAVREAEARLESLRTLVDELRGAENFFECPGKACPSCPFADRCGFGEPESPRDFPVEEPQ